MCECIWRYRRNVSEYCHSTGRMNPWLDCRLGSFTIPLFRWESMNQCLNIASLYARHICWLIYPQDRRAERAIPKGKRFSLTESEIISSTMPISITIGPCTSSVIASFWITNICATLRAVYQQAAPLGFICIKFDFNNNVQVCWVAPRRMRGRRWGSFEPFLTYFS